MTKEITKEIPMIKFIKKIVQRIRLKNIKIKGFYLLYYLDPGNAKSEFISMVDDVSMIPWNILQNQRYFIYFLRKEQINKKRFNPFAFGESIDEQIKQEIFMSGKKHIDVHIPKHTKEELANNIMKADVTITPLNN